VVGRTGVWTQGFKLAKQVFNCFSHTSSPSWFWDNKLFYIYSWGLIIKEGLNFILLPLWPISGKYPVEIQKTWKATQRRMSIGDKCSNKDGWLKSFKVHSARLREWLKW
jgi:hypothetical protein